MIVEGSVGAPPFRPNFNHFFISAPRLNEKLLHTNAA